MEAATHAWGAAEAALHEAATVAAGGPTDFGPDRYRAGLRVLLEAMHRELALEAPFRERVESLLIRSLVSRLWSQRGWVEHPQCLSRPVHAPLIVTGIPRTGTTALHKLLAVDKQFQGLDQWLIATPMPRPPRSEWNALPQFRAAVQAQEAMFQAIPALRENHAVQPDEVDECLLLVAQDFVSNFYGSVLPLPSYDAWFLAQDESPAFARFADNLRLIGANEPGKRWLLKNPSHVLSIDALLTTFPDACIVQTHRDPGRAIPSACSLISGIREFFIGARYDPAELGRREAQIWKIAMDRTMAARALHEARFFDVDFHRFNREPLAVVEEIYAFAGLNLDKAVRAAMRDWLESHAHDEIAAHHYTAEQFGLDAGTLRRSYEHYMHRFGLDREYT